MTAVAVGCSAWFGREGERRFEHSTSGIEVLRQAGLVALPLLFIERALAEACRDTRRHSR